MSDQTPSRSAAQAVGNQFMSTFQMLRTFVDVCPQAVWESRFFGFPYPVWYQAYHAAYFIDYWLQDDYRGERAL